MKRITKNILLLTGLAISQLGFANENADSTKKEEFAPSGKISATIYANVATEFANDELTEAGINLGRAYFGYKYHISPEFTAYVKLDVGNPKKALGSYEFEGTDTAGVPVEVDAHGNFAGMYAYFKNAGVQYKKSGLSVDFGLIDQYVFKFQEKAWGHRYVAKSFMDINKYANSADLGVYAKYKIHKMVSIDLSASNGEGYKKVQTDQAFRVGGGLIFTPIDGLTVRGYFDNYQPDGYADPMQTIVAFAGYKVGKKASIGFEYDTQSNYKGKGEDQAGISGSASYNVTDKIEVFGRYDMLMDVNSTVFGGVQFKLHNKVKLAFDYQGKTPDGGDAVHGAFAHVEVKF